MSTSSGLRNRKHPSNSVTTSDSRRGLNKPLLGDDDESDCDAPPPRAQHHQPMGSRQTSADSVGSSSGGKRPQSLWKSRKHTGWETASSTGWSALCAVLDVLPSKVSEKVATAPTEAERKQLLAFQETCLMPYDKENRAHSAKLRLFWKQLHRHVLPKNKGGCTEADITADTLVTENWKHFGFQGVDPATDFRGAGVLALDNLIFVSEAHPQLVTLCNQEEFPFAIAGINITMTLLNLLGLTHGKKTCLSTTHTNTNFSSHKARYQFAALLTFPQMQETYYRAANPNHYDFFDQEPFSPAPGTASAFPSSSPQLRQPSAQTTFKVARAFNVVYCVALYLLHKEWMASKRNILEFNSVLKNTKAKLELLLRDADSLLDLGKELPDEFFEPMPDLFTMPNQGEERQHHEAPAAVAASK